MLVILLGALLVIGGLLYMVAEALRRGRLSGTAGSSAQSAADVRDGTLEPVRHGVGFLGIAGNWPGLAMMALGAILLLFGPAFV